MYKNQRAILCNHTNVYKYGNFILTNRLNCGIIITVEEMNSTKNK
nr:MAG TPA: hypothetical protein [Caudoviricetes sp.]